MTTEASRSAALQPPRTVAPLVTLAVPSFNQGQFLDDALSSIFAQRVPVEVFVADAGSDDGTLEVLHHWAPRLAGWRSRRDGCQAMAINKCIALGSAPYVAWLNSDDIYLPGGLQALVDAMDRQPDWMAAHGNAWNTDASLRRTSRVWVHSVTPWRLAQHCMIAQPASLIRRSAWEALQGLDESLHMALDYDLWWRLLRRLGPPGYVTAEIACNRVHDATKTRTLRRLHYEEAMSVVRRHYGRVPAKWYLAWPISVWLREKLVPQAATKPRLDNRLTRWWQ